MAESKEPTVAMPAGKVRQTISSAPWVRAMRFIIAAVAAYLLYHAAMRFRSGNLSPTDAWLAGMIGTLGLTALVEAIWPEGNHGLLQYWALTTLASAALVAWAMGGQTWIGLLGLVTLIAGFALAAMEAAKGK